jgi:hypothetical protein
VHFHSSTIAPAAVTAAALLLLLLLLLHLWRAGEWAIIRGSCAGVFQCACSVIA